MLVFIKFIQRNSKVLLLHDNARPHTSVSTNEAITIFGWAVLLHPSPSGFSMFHHLKGSLLGYHYVDENTIQALYQQLQRKGSLF